MKYILIFIIGCSSFPINLTGQSFKPEDSLVDMSKKDSEVIRTVSFNSEVIKDFKPIINKRQAMRIAARHHSISIPITLYIIEEAPKGDQHTIYDTDGFYASNPEVRLIYILDAKTNELKLTWQTLIYLHNAQYCYRDHIDVFTGEVVYSNEKYIDNKIDIELGIGSSQE